MTSYTCECGYNLHVECDKWLTSRILHCTFSRLFFKKHATYVNTTVVWVIFLKNLWSLNLLYFTNAKTYEFKGNIVLPEDDGYDLGF
jgi:hypothetical protein